MENLVRRAASGDRDAVQAVLRRVEPRVRRAVRRQLADELRSRVMTDDLHQSTLVAVVDALPQLTYRSEAEFEAWLVRIAQRQVRMAARFHRAQRRDAGRERSLTAARRAPAAVTSPTASARRSETALRMREAVALLPSPDREVVELHSLAGLGFREVAARTGISGASTARYVFRRALARLAALLDGEDDCVDSTR